MSGPLAEGVVPQLLREIYVRRRNGWLHVVRGEERQSLRFRRGHIVNARTNVVQERMGELMVRRGWLSEADLARATEIVIRDKKRLGEVLTELGLVDASRLEDAVAYHVHEMLTKLFTWDEGEYSFEDEEEDAGGELTLKLSTGELILEAVQAVRDPDVVRYALGDMDRVLAPSDDPLLRFQKLKLSPTDGFVLSRVDGTTSAREVVQMIPLPAEDVERSLFGLLSTGVVEFTANVRREKAAAAAAAAAAPPAPAGPPAGATPPAATPPPAPPTPPSPPSPSLAQPAMPPATPTQPAPPAQPATPPATPPDEPAAAAEDRGGAEQRREIQEAWEGLKTRNHFEVLGLARNATETDVKEAYFRLAKRFHPDVHHGSSLGDLHDQLEAVFIRLGEAYEVLRDTRRRAHYEERLGRPRSGGPTTPASGTPAPTGGATPAGAPAAPDEEEDARVAEEAIWRAQKLYEKAEQREKGEHAEGSGSEYWDAIQVLEPIVHKLQGKLRSKGDVLLSRCYLKNPKWARRAEETLLGVTRRDPAAAEAWALLGGIYAGKGMQNRALSMYRKALELRPEHEEAAQYVASHRVAEEPASPPREGGGLFRKLFRKP